MSTLPPHSDNPTPDDLFLITDMDGTPTAFMDTNILTSIGISYAYAMAAACDDPERMDAIVAEVLDRVGHGQPYTMVCAAALRALAQFILSPTLDVAETSGFPLREKLRTLSAYNPI